MRIAVCDDEKFFLDYLKDAVHSYARMNRLDIVIDDYESGVALLDSIVDYDMVFLDYKMDGIDGLETARILRKRNLSCTIIFMTNYPHFVRESFEVSTFRFYKKPLDIEKLYSALNNYFDLLCNDYPVLLKANAHTVCVRANDIVYLEAHNKSCDVHLTDGKLRCPITMAATAKLLPMNIFFKVSKAFFVNFNHIADFNNERIVFKNGAIVYISRKYLISFKKAFMNYSRYRPI